MFTQPK